MPLLTDWNRQRQAAAGFYSEHLAGTEGLRLPPTPDGSEPVWHLYVVRSRSRDALRAHLLANGVDTLIHYPMPPHRQPACADMGFDPDAFPIASLIANEVLSLPIGPHLSTDQQAAVIDAVKTFVPRP